MIISCFALGFLYDGVFLYAACVLCIIFGLAFAVDGFHLKTGETIETSIGEGNSSLSEITYDYVKYDDTMTNAIGLIFILLGIAFIYFEKKDKNDKKDQEGQTGKWL